MKMITDFAKREGLINDFATVSAASINNLDVVVNNLSKPFDGIFEYCKLNFISQLNRVNISRYNGFVLFHKAALPSGLFKTFVQEII